MCINKKLALSLTVVFLVFLVIARIVNAVPNGTNDIFNTVNVGIGTLTPQATLSVLGNMGIGTWTTAGGNLIINGGGNVGISSAWPGTALDVNGTQRMAGFNLTTGASSGYILVTNSVGVGTWMAASTVSHITAPGGTTPQLQYDNSSSFGGVTGSGADGNGNMGLGTTGPNNTLDIVGNVGIGTIKYSSFVTTSTFSGGLIIEKNIGIGTTAPSAALDVNGAIDISGANGISYPSSDTTPGGSIAIGLGALATENAAGSAAYGNTAVGYQSMGLGTMTTAAIENTAVGFQAMADLTSGSANTAVGYQALMSITSGTNNTAVGYQALENVGIGSYNTAVGYRALASITSATDDTAAGYEAGMNVTASNVSVLGYEAGMDAGQNSSAAGTQALKCNTGQNNTAIGYDAMSDCSGSDTGSDNTVFGYQVGAAITSGSNNTIIGTGVGSSVLTTGSNNILIGMGTTSNVVDVLTSGTNNELNIGNLLRGDMTNATETLYLSSTSNSVDYLQIAGGAAASPGVVTISGQGTDSNVTIELLPKGSGNVGIGTSSFSPQSKMDVAGGLGLGSYAGIDAAPSNGIIVSGNVGIGTWIATGGILIVNGGGNVGINSSWPGTALDINGTERMTGFDLTTGAAAGDVLVTNSIGVGTWMASSTLASGSPGGSSAQLEYDNGGSFGGVTGSTVNSSGNLGLGTTVPHDILSVVGGVGIGTVSSSSFVNTTAPSGELIVEKNIGIATTIPEAALDVKGSIYLSGVNAISYPSSDTTPGGSIAIGLGALATQNTAGSAAYGNTAVGYEAMGLGTMTTAAVGNTAVGYEAFENLTSGTANTAIGGFGGPDIALTSGSYNTLIGGSIAGTSSNSVTSIGGGSEFTGSNSTFLGAASAQYVTTGNNITIYGAFDGQYIGDESVIIGTNIYNNSTGTQITTFGGGPGGSASGNDDTFLGAESGSVLTSGAYDTIIGISVASTTLTTGSNNILIGYNSAVDTAASGTNNNLNIGNLLQGDMTNSNATYNTTLFLQGTANGVDYLQVAGAATGNPGKVVVSGQGSDTNVSIELSPQGTGGVGIATSSPQSMLDVAGGMAIGSYAGANAAPTNGLIVSGNVGIGSTVPGEALDLNANVRTRGTNAQYFGDDAKAAILASAATNGDLRFLTNNAEIMRITYGGNVGIGTTTPQGALVVTDGNVGIGTWAPGAALVVQGGNVGIGTNTANYKLQIGGCTSKTGTTSCVDLAELIPSSQEAGPADVMMLDRRSSATVMKATKEENNLLFGVVTTNPAIVIEGSSVGIMNGKGFKANPMKPAIALAGRVPVKVNLENGPIEVGDMIVSSSMPGVGAKAVNAGRVIGMALEPLTDLGDKPYKDILVYVNPHWWPGENQGHWTQVEDRQDLFEGALLCATGETVNEGQGRIIKSRVCSSANDPAVWGVYGGDDGPNHSIIIAGGEGYLMVANKGEDLHLGDYLMSSQITGFAEKQAGPAFMNDTAAKLMENIHWNPGEKSRKAIVFYQMGKLEMNR